MPEFVRKDQGERPVISLIVPVYNEADNIWEFHTKARKVLEDLQVPWEILYVNDGSRDSTLGFLVAMNQQERRVKVIDLSRNFGKEVAISAGLDHASGDAVIPIDADLQHPPEVIGELVNKWRYGCDIVFAARQSRKDEGFFRRIAVKFFYSLLGWLTDVPNPSRIGDFCLLDRRVVNVLRQLPEHNRFMKGLFAWVGFRQGCVMYDPQPRKAGKTKWNYWRLWNFAIEGITSFSSVPLRVWTYFGFVLAMLSLSYAAFIVIRTVVFGVDVPGYASLIVGILFMGGVQLISLGIIGEYIGRIYKEVKLRPLYFVTRLYGFDSHENDLKGVSNNELPVRVARAGNPGSRSR